MTDHSKSTFRIIVALTFFMGFFFGIVFGMTLFMRQLMATIGIIADNVKINSVNIELNETRLVDGLSGYVNSTVERLNNIQLQRCNQ